MNHYELIKNNFSIAETKSSCANTHYVGLLTVDHNDSYLGHLTVFQSIQFTVHISKEKAC